MEENQMSMENIGTQSPSSKTPAENAPRHWIGPEELDPSYWANDQVKEKRAQEFHDKPIETLEMIERMDTKGVARREFLTLMGASMAMASFACARRPVHKIIPYVVKPEELVPGVANYYASTDPTTGYGLLVKTREGRPIKLEGNPEHPLNRGALTARGQAALLDLYDTERLREPAQGDRKGNRKALTVAELDSAVAAKLKAHQGRVRVLTGPVHGETSRKLISEFTRQFGGEHVEFDFLGLDEVADGQEESFGSAVLPAYRLDQCEVVVSLGADFLGTWPFALEHSRQFMAARKLNDKAARQTRMSKLTTFEPTMTVTGANSDERFGVRPGDEYRIAMALAHELVVNRRLSRYASDLAVVASLGGYKVETIATEIGIEPKVLRDLASSLWEARGRSLVLAGGIATRNRDARALQIVTNFLNVVLENEGKTVDGTANYGFRRGEGFSGVWRLIRDMKSGGVGALVIAGVNPCYLLEGLGFEEALSKVDTVVVSGLVVDETARCADYIAADLHFLENWGDAQVRKGYISLQQPVIAPIHAGCRGFQDSLLSWMGRKEVFHDYLKTNWKDSVYREVGGAAPFEVFWEGALREGVIDLFAAKGTEPKPTARSFKSTLMTSLPRFSARPSQAISLALYPTMALYDGSQAGNAWLQEMPDPISTVTWDNYVNIGPTLASKMGFVKNEVVKVTWDGETLELPINIQPGIHPYAVSIPVGYGRSAAGKVGSGVGKSVYGWARSVSNQLVFSGQNVTLERTGKLYKLAETQWHHAAENRPVINDITLAQFKKDPTSANHTDPHLRLDPVPTMWPRFEYKGYRWGMAIDLSSCTGCGACVVACQAENNIPVVGRNNVRVSREMHWIRIDRYYSGSPDQPSVIFQPMLCQHCENAPCETVCPVLATVHDDEGTNNQVYNRCVGTRYCQNNCPYKVRRFNFFDHWKSYEGTLNMVFNPDVTVRSRGIMEKCTFCIQRVRKAKDDAALKGDKIPDGELKTACQQTCPTEAIVFGDINDSSTRVAQMAAAGRAFRSLEVLNTRPAISYLSKVRNREAEADHGHH
jgi:molybdopterin-containing oxidoreductase family iron-sulfur binding subunit